MIKNAYFIEKVCVTLNYTIISHFFKYYHKFKKASLMKTYLLLLISMFCALFANIIKKHSTARFEAKSSLRFFFNAVISLSCVVVFFIISGVPEISAFTLLLGMLFGLITAIQFFFSLLSYQSGPFSYTSVIISLSTIISALSGYFIWGEKIAPIQIVGMALMLTCFVLSVDFSKSNKKASPAWFIYVFITFLATGFIGVMQKWHQSSDYKNELDGFLIVAFSCSFIFSIIGFFISEVKKGRENADLKIKKSDFSWIFIVLMICCGACAAANNKMNLYLSGAMDSAIFFPVVNGGGMILSTLASIVLFKEKFNIQKWLGIAIGVIAVVLLCNPF